MTDQTSPAARGTFECPICGLDARHQHPASARRWAQDHARSFLLTMRQNGLFPRFASQDHHPKGDGIEFWNPELQGLWIAYCAGVEFPTNTQLEARPNLRDKTLEEVVQAIDASGLDQRTMFAWFVRGLKSQQPAQADKPDIESIHAARAIAAYEASGATTPWTYLDPAEWSKWEKIADAVHALSKG